MAIDYGTVRIGVAIGDPLGVVARGLETIKVKKHDPQAAVERIVELVRTTKLVQSS